MKIVYIAHPISGDVENNLKKVLDIIKGIRKDEPKLTPIAPYYVDCLTLDDNNPKERNTGIALNHFMLKCGIVSELRLYGEYISQGMWDEIRIAQLTNISIKPMTIVTLKQYDDYWKNLHKDFE